VFLSIRVSSRSGSPKSILALNLKPSETAFINASFYFGDGFCVYPVVSVGLFVGAIGDTVGDAGCAIGVDGKG